MVTVKNNNNLIRLLQSRIDVKQRGCSIKKKKDKHVFSNSRQKNLFFLKNGCHSSSLIFEILYIKEVMLKT